MEKTGNVCREKLTSIIRNGLVVSMNFTINTIVVGTPSKTNLFGLDASNGVQVEVHIGQAVEVETIPMTEQGKNRLVYQRP